MDKNLYQDILQELPEGTLQQVRIGVRWTAVMVEVNGKPRCGLASTLDAPHDHTGSPTIPAAGSLESLSALDLAGWILSDVPLRRSVGCAVINALLPKDTSSFITENADQAILRRGRGKKTVLVGHFPFVPDLRQALEDFHVVDQHPQEGDLPASAAPEIIPRAGVVAITGMTFLNHTLVDLLSLCAPEAFVLLLGPTTPLSPTLAEYGVDLLAGSIVEDIPAVLRAVSQGANFRQAHRAGVRLVLQSLSKRKENA
jgi:hypothetical protein